MQTSRPAVPERIDVIGRAIRLALGVMASGVVVAFSIADFIRPAIASLARSRGRR